ncbi:MAG: hypothetical protein GF375_03705, partial [Candidatus Omnitrophica bacterium]|nr:hypothetical protein [Candidatus Omnitrophota bacterium]MBD3269166.1 hypothetical protein [Candidatus Omnitrophota bacterium]
MRRFLFFIGDNIFKWFLFVWRFLFWFVIGIIFFLFMMNALPRGFSWAFSYILLSILFYKYIYKVNKF